MSASPSQPTQIAQHEAERTIAPPPNGEPDLAAPGQAPAVADGYRFGKILGYGGEGEVHAAIQLAFGRAVAIKTLRSNEPSPRLLRRFRAEAAVTALLEHPNIIPVHDLRLGADGKPQLVMKLVGGRTWRQLLDGEPPAAGRPPLTGEEHVDILLKVCDAMSFAHSHGILHRDLKPENIMVGAHGEVLVMDWGCAAHLGPKAPNSDIPVLTQLGGVSGTPAYLAPEQARGDLAACGPWSDVFLLGGILYRMLTGSPPWMAANAKETIRLAAKGEAPQEPSKRAGRKVPSELARICQHALQPDPAQRIRSVDELAAAVRRYVEHREVHRLLAEARRQHELAKAGGTESDDAYRRAINAVEQALQLWPEQTSARRLFIEVGLDSARHAIAAGAYRVAKRQASAARQEADRLGDAAGIESAGKLSSLADARERAQRKREASLHTMRKLAVAGGAVAGLALLVGLLAVWRSSAHTAEALEEAKRNLDRFESERAARVEGERLAAPALLAQARELALARQFDDALRLAIAASGFAAQDPAPEIVAAQMLVALGRRSEALPHLDRALTMRPDPDAAELRRLCASPPPDAEARIAAVLVRMGAGGAAGAMNVAAEQRVALARAQLTKAWPRLPASAVSALPDGTVQVSIRPATLEIDTLEPLRGLPVTILDVGGQKRIRDISPLASLPLTGLYAWSAPIQDLSPLRGMKLTRVSLSGVPLTDFTLFAGMRLEYVDLSAPALQDLDPFVGMPLRELRIYGAARIEDISALASAPLELLLLDGPRNGSTHLTSLTPLRGRPLRDISLLNQRGVSDLEPLRGAPVNRAILGGTSVTDLAPIANPALRILSIVETPVGDLRPLLRCPLETVDLAPQGIRAGLEGLLKLPTLKAVNGLRPEDFTAWLALQRAIAAVNPDYAWDARPSFVGGKLTELRFEAGLRNLDPVKALPLRLLRVERGAITGLDAIAGLPLEELELPGCQVASVAALARMSTLRRLNLSGCPVPDLSPLEGLPLEALIFTPNPKLAGVEVLRRMRSLKRIGATAAQLMEPAAFWQALDRGDLK